MKWLMHLWQTVYSFIIGLFPHKDETTPPAVEPAVVNYEKWTRQRNRAAWRRAMWANARRPDGSPEVRGGYFIDRHLRRDEAFGRVDEA